MCPYCANDVCESKTWNIKKKKKIMNKNVFKIMKIKIWKQIKLINSTFFLS